MAKATDPETIAVVFNSDGSYVACTTPEEVLAAADAVVAARGKPVLFHRTGHGRSADVVNINHGGTGGVQARDIHGGVRL